MRLFVTGPTGSGKSTLAAKLAHKAGLPLFPLDDIHWIRHPSGDKRRDPAERVSMLENIVRREAWVVEGVQFKWADGALERADRIIVLDPPRWRNTARILRRFGSRCRSREAGGRATLTALLEEMRWSADYYGHERKMLFEKLGRWPGKLVVARSYRDEQAIAEAVFALALERLPTDVLPAA